MQRFFGDYHTHTFYSDAINSPKSLLEMAKNQGYKEIAITDHGCANKFKALTQKKIKKLALDIEELRRLYPDITIYQGYEGDLTSFDGTTDISDDIMAKMDVILLGFHRYITPKYFKEIFTFVLNNGFISKFFGYSKKLVEKNTQALLTALKQRKVNILAHINHNMKVDCKKIASFCAEKGIFVEINIKHLNIMEKVIGEILPTGCIFIAN
ncbi:MAG TPA: PHP domain-containing protein, partial [Clostridia bacterium]|nr:PHP domain-containing protein [Clostridia bacterium]